MTRFSTFSGQRKPLARVSAKRKRQDAELDISRLVVRQRSDDRCEAALDGCLGRGNHAHHVTPRSVRVDHSPQNLLFVCAPCHSRIHNETRMARGLGLLSDPATVRPSRPTDTGAEVDEAAFPGGQVPGRRFAE